MSINLKENESYLVEEILPHKGKNKKKIIYKSFEDLSNNADNIFVISTPVKIFKINNKKEIIEELSVAEIYNIIEPGLEYSHYKYLINNINLNYFAMLGTLDEKLFLAKQGLCIEILILDSNEYIRKTINKYLTEDIFSKLDNLTLETLSLNCQFPNLFAKSDNSRWKMNCLGKAESIKTCNYFLNDSDVRVREFAENRKEYIKKMRINNE